MGYHTQYTISAVGDNNFLNQSHPSCEHSFDSKHRFCGECGKPRVSIENVEQLVTDFIDQLHPGWGRFNPFGDSCKWYEHDDDMKALSKKYPKTIFVLEGKGEEPEDIWRAYYQNGKMQLCKASITFDDFDRDKLK